MKYVRIPGFWPLNAYIWRGRDARGNRNYTGWLFLRRLRMLRSHRRFLR